jgi:hypothetical protein
MKLLLSIGIISLLSACATSSEITPSNFVLNDPAQFEKDKEFCKNLSKGSHGLYNDCMMSRGYLTPGSSKRSIRACVFTGKYENDIVPWHNGEKLTVRTVIQRNSPICKNPKAPDLLLVG